ncbi:MAG: glycosyltransferase [Humibacillus sp.]|nr:glycosyltransferase [Humibacillus sp.]
MRVLRVSHSAVVDSWRERERSLRHLGHQVEVVTARRWHEAGGDTEPTPSADESVVTAATIGRHPALFAYDPRPLWRALGRPLDVVDVHEEPFSLAAAEVLALRWLRRQRAPYVLYTAQNLDKRYPPPFRWLERAALRGARGVSACNDAAARIAERKGYPGHAATIDLGTDLATFSPAEEGARPLGGASGAARAVSASVGPTVGYAGRLAPEKGVDTLLRAAALVPDLVVRIAGDGPERSALEALAHDLSLDGRVHFVGVVPSAELPSFYRSLDVLAVPSLTTASWVEQFGRVVLEAMACGTPVVVSDSGALPGVVGDAALVVPEGDPAALAAALRQAGSDPDTHVRLRSAGLRRAAAGSWAQVAEAYDDLYRLATHDLHDTAPTGGLEVVVVAYGQPALLARALAPLEGLSVTVVDNSSSQAVRAVVATTGARYVDPGRNGGFAAGVNEGLRRADPEADVLLVNPDAVIDRDGIEALRVALAADDTLASVGPAQFDGDGRPSRVTWPFPSPLGTWVDAVGLARLRRDSYVIGSVLLLRRAALDHVGPFDDERFFLYAEETDWAYRATLLGWGHRVVDDVHVEHAGAATSTDDARRESHFLAAHESYLRKHHGTVGWQVSRAGSIAGSLARAMASRGPAREAARARAMRYLRGPARHEQRPADARPAPASAA